MLFRVALDSAQQVIEFCDLTIQELSTVFHNNVAVFRSQPLFLTNVVINIMPVSSFYSRFLALPCHSS